MPTDQPATPKQKLRWYRPTPGRLLVVLLAVEVILLLCDWYRWTPKGWAVLIAIGVVAVTMVLMLLWFSLALLFRWRFQFSLRSLLLQTIAVAVPCSWVAVEMKSAQAQEKAVKLASSVCYDYQQQRTTVRHDYPWPEGDPADSDLLWNLFGRDFFANVTIYETDIFDPPYLTDDDLDGIKGMTQLEYLCLERTLITDAGLTRLKDLSHLQSLFLRGTRISDKGLEYLISLDQLTWLDLKNTAITDAGLKHLERFAQLYRLTLSGTKVTDAGVAKLQKALPNCKIER